MSIHHIYETKKTEITHKNIPFTIFTSFEEEDIPLEDTFDNSINNIKYLYSHINKGELVYFCVVVKAYYEDMEISFDSLGACLYTSFDEFINEPNGYYQDMINSVLSSGYEKLTAIQSILNSLNQV